MRKKRANPEVMVKNKFRKSNWWVLAQIVLGVLILFLPLKLTLNLPHGVQSLGFVLMVSGGLLAVYSAISLKKNFRPSPQPRTGGYLVTSGLYGIIRHPAYAFIILAVFGLSIWTDDVVRVMLAVCLSILFDAKTRVEERWLEKTYPEYAEYKKKIRHKFIPGLY